jgi:hypothetical protein
MSPDPSQVRPDDLRRAHPEAWTKARARAGAVLATAPSTAALEARARELAASAAEAKRAGASARFVDARLELHALTTGLREIAARGGAVAARPRQPSRLAARVATLRAALATWAVDKLLFTKERARQVPDARVFRWVWTKLPAGERAKLATAVQGLGIYVVFTKQFVDAVASLAAGRPVLEIGAGDGTLALALEAKGLTVTACDDRSWSHRVRCPSWVVDGDGAAEAERTRAEVAVCAWPPPGNAFERSLLLSKRGAALRTYVVVLGAEDGAAGAAAVYREAEASGAWRVAGRPDLARWLMPPELGSRVLVLERNQGD